MSKKLAVALLAAVVVSAIATHGLAEFKIRSFVRVKGQEVNRLHGMGVVVGLKNGNGDPEADPTLRALFLVAKRLNNSVTTAEKARDELKGYKNAALVTVTATVPGSGAREGDLIDCQVQALGAKNLEGGRLIFADLVSTDTRLDHVFAQATGPLTVERNSPTTARIKRGAQLVADFYSKFVADNEITLVIKESHASFSMSHEIAMIINDSRDFQNLKESQSEGLARAIDARNVVVRIPEKYRSSPVEFISYVLDTRFVRPPKNARVLIRRSKGLVVIDPNVEILPVAVTHKSLAIAPDGGTPVGQFVEVDPTSEGSTTTKLQDLVNALKSLKVPTADIIEIIIAINDSGALYGELVIEK